MDSPGTTVSNSVSLGTEHHGVSSQAIWGGQGQRQSRPHVEILRPGLLLTGALIDRAWDLPLEETCSSGR